MQHIALKFLVTIRRLLILNTIIFRFGLWELEAYDNFYLWLVLRYLIIEVISQVNGSSSLIMT